MPGTYAYIDGLNVYYGALKSGPHKWLDYEALVRRVLPVGETLTLIRYFSAPIKPRHPGDKSHERQAAYLRALSNNPLVEYTPGHFISNIKWRRLPHEKLHTRDLFRPHFRPMMAVRAMISDAVRRRSEPSTVAHVVVPEEKGSDVNLAVHLLHDALTGLSQRAVVFSNDSDLAEAVKLTVQAGVDVRIVNPHRAPTSAHLKRAATAEIPFPHRLLGSFQLPNVVPLANGKQARRPKEW